MILPTLTTNSGSLDSLNVWLRCGKPNAAHMRRIVVWKKPVSAAIERIDWASRRLASAATFVRSPRQPDRR